MPLVVEERHADHLRTLLHQGEVWVGRARWARWLESGDDADTMLIDEMVPDDRIAACAWLRQQRHVLHGVVADASRTPDGWVEQLPLYRALCPRG